MTNRTTEPTIAERLDALDRRADGIEQRAERIEALIRKLIEEPPSAVLTADQRLEIAAINSELRGMVQWSERLAPRILAAKQYLPALEDDALVDAMQDSGVEVMCDLAQLVGDLLANDTVPVADALARIVGTRSASDERVTLRDRYEGLFPAE